MAEPAEASNTSIHLAGGALHDCGHVGALFHDEDEANRVLIPFIVEGLRKGDKALHLVDAKALGRHLERLKQAGIDVADAQRTGQLEIVIWEETFLRGGQFDHHRTVAQIQQLLERGKSQRFPRTRLVSYVGWVFDDAAQMDEFFEYEARICWLMKEYRDPLI